ncbi:MAG: hypothetical protein JSS91_07130 [Bacteroidetes bacterium]|nr:hypothetical protein [Bacteroidota bacterium]
MDDSNVITYQEIQSVISGLGNNEKFSADLELIENFLSDYYEYSITERDKADFPSSFNYITAGFNLCTSAINKLDLISAQNKDENLKELFERKIADLKMHVLKFTAANNFTTGLFHYTNRNPGLANQFFSECEKNFKELFNITKDGRYVIQSDLSKYFRHMSEGLEKFITGDLIDARKNYQIAKIGFEDIVKKLELDISDESRYLKIKIDYICRDCSTLLHMSNAQFYFRSKNYKLAVENYEKLLANIKSTVDDVSGENADEDTEKYKNFYMGNYYYNCGYMNISKALENQKQEKWDEALESFDHARNDWTRATDFLLKSDIQQALTLQETISHNEFSIDQYIESCMKDKEHCLKIIELEEKVRTQQEELFNMLKPAGITVNNIQDINNTVEQNVQIVQKIENKTRENLKELLELLKSVPMNEAEKKTIESEGKELVNSTEKGPKFLDKAKSFTEKVSGIVKNVGEIATPIIPVVKALAMMLA